ncbi:hypothetical protein ABFV05_020594 [Capra hircus]
MCPTRATAPAAESFEGVGTASDEHAGRHENWTRGELARLEKRSVQTQTMVSSSQTKAARFPTSPRNDSGLGPPWTAQPRRAQPPAPGPEPGTGGESSEDLTHALQTRVLPGPVLAL